MAEKTMIELENLEDSITAIEVAITALEQEPTAKNAERVCLATRMAWALFVPAHENFCVDIALGDDLFKLLKKAHESVNLAPPSANNAKYLVNIARRKNTLAALLAGETETYRMLLQDAIAAR